MLRISSTGVQFILSALLPPTTRLAGEVMNGVGVKSVTLATHVYFRKPSLRIKMNPAAATVVVLPSAKRSHILGYSVVLRFLS